MTTKATRVNLYHFILPAVFLLAGCAAMQTSQDRFNELANAADLSGGTDKSDYENELNLAITYKRLFADDLSLKRLKRLADTDLILLFRATEVAGFYSNEPLYFANIELVMNELKLRNIDSPAHHAAQYGMAIKARQFEKARQLEILLPNADSKLPNFVIQSNLSETDPSAWSVDLAERVAVRQNVDLAKDWMLVIVSHPNCHFSRNAARDIYADELLTRRLAGRTIWITPQESKFEFETLQKWNKAQPNAATMVVHLSNLWPLTNFKSTPYFYFLKKGRVVERFEGWPKNGRKDQLIAALDQVEKE